MRPRRPPPSDRRRSGVPAPRRDVGIVVDGLARRGARPDVIVIDNYDSFTRNLSDALATLGANVAVVRNDAASARAVFEADARGLVLSPGPHAPDAAGITLELVRHAPVTLPILGVCLGHQALGVAFGGRVVRAGTPVHGRALAVRHHGAGLLAGLPNPFLAARYHSLVVERATLPAALEITATSDDGEIMGLRHRERPVEGIQFHPESFLTPIGPRLLAAFLRRCGVSPRAVGSARR